MYLATYCVLLMPERERGREGKRERERERRGVVVVAPVLYRPTEQFQHSTWFSIYNNIQDKNLFMGWHIACLPA